VALETSVRRFSRIDDRPSAAAGLNVQTPWSVARLATHVLGVFAFRLQSRVSGGPEVAHDLFVARRAFLRADELRARNAGRSENCSISRATGKQNDGERDGSSGAPK
jgi:hypothetical protein